MNVVAHAFNDRSCKHSVTIAVAVRVIVAANVWEFIAEDVSGVLFCVLQ